MRKKCYIYTRVSTAAQTEEYSLEAQTERLRKYADYKEMEVVREYCDAGRSGMSIKGRPAFMEMMDLAEQDKTERLLSKTTPDWVGTALLSDSFLRKILTVWVVRYIAIMNNIDTDKGISDPVPMQDLFNEWHAKNSSQKVRNVFRNK